MTREEALAFLERNPKLKKLYEMREMRDGMNDDVWSKLDRLWLFGDVTNEADAFVDIVEVFKALDK